MAQQQMQEQEFRRLLQGKLEGNYGRALRLYKNCPNIAWDLTNVLLHAGEQKKSHEVLQMLEDHYDKHLAYQHPDIRGLMSGAFGNPTQFLLLKICTEVLGLKPDPE